MTAAKHREAAQRLHRLAEETNVSLQLAAERDDATATLRHHADRNALLDLAAWHEEQAATKALAALDGPHVEGLTDGPVHLIPANTPGDDAIVA